MAAHVIVDVKPKHHEPLGHFTAPPSGATEHFNMVVVEGV